MNQPTEPTYHLDVLGESCPYPTLQMLEAMKEIEPNEILEVISDCGQSMHNIPRDAKNHGYTVLKAEQNGAQLVFWIQK